MGSRGATMMLCLISLDESLDELPCPLMKLVTCDKVLSNEIFIDALTNCGACAILVSEENEVCTWLWSSCFLRG